MFHKNIIQNTDNIHTPFNWVVADEAARLALVPIAADLYKALWQVDTGAVYILTNISPIVWNEISGNANSSRETLTADRIYYVRTDGDDTNNGLTDDAAGAFLTIQAAIDAAVAIDGRVFNITIQLRDGTYAGAVISSPFMTKGVVKILGNVTTPANVITDRIQAGNGAALLVESLKLTSASSFNLYVYNNGSIQFKDVQFDTATAAHMRASAGGILQAVGNYSIVGAAPAHWQVILSGAILVGGRTITLTGTPNFSTAFADAAINGSMETYSNVFIGTASGKRYNITTNGSIQTYGASTTAFPGTIAGTLATGGVYA